MTPELHAVSGLAGTRVAVTGASGFIGSHVSALLRESGAVVVGIDRVPGAAVTADLMDPASRDDVFEAINGADALVHLAASGQRSDVVGALAVAMGALRPDVPVVVSSCAAVYGSTYARRDGVWRGSREDDPLRPLGSHGRAHVLVERLSTRRRTYGNRVAIVRPFTVVGEGQPASASVARMISAAQQGDVIPLPGGPARVRDVIDVRDVARGIAVALREQADGLVNLGSGTPVRLDEIAAAIGAATGRSVDTVRAPAGPGVPAATCADVERMQELLGFEATVDLAELIARQVAATRDTAPV